MARAGDRVRTHPMRGVLPWSANGRKLPPAHQPEHLNAGERDAAGTRPHCEAATGSGVIIMSDRQVPTRKSWVA